MYAMPLIRTGICLILFVVGASSQLQAQINWIGNINNNWFDSGNWSPGVVPNGVGVTTNFAAIGGTQNIFLGGNFTIGQMSFSSTRSYNFEGVNTLTFDNTGSSNTILNLPGTNRTVSFSSDTTVSLQDTLSATVDTSNTVSFLGNVTGPGGIIKDGGGTLRLFSSANTLPHLTVNAGSVLVSNSAVLHDGALVTINGGAVNIRDGEHFGSAVVNGGQLTLGGSSIIKLTSTATALSVRGGTSVVGAVQLTGGGTAVTIAFDATNNGTGSILFNSVFDLGGGSRILSVANGTAATDLELIGTATNGALRKTGAGTLHFANIEGVNNYSSLSIEGGTVTGLDYNFNTGLRQTTNFGNGIITLSNDGRILIPTISGGNDVVFNQPLAISTGATATFKNDSTSHIVDLAGIISGTGQLTFEGPGTVRLTGSAVNTHTGTVRITGGTVVAGKTVTNAINGPVLIEGGTLRLDPPHQINDTSPVTVNGGTFFLNSYNETVGTFSGTGGTVNLGVGNLVVTQGSNGNFAGVIAGTSSGTFTKSGSARLYLQGSDPNTFSGLTRVDQGILFLDKPANTLAISGNLEINSGDAGGVWTLQSHQIGDTSSVTVNSGSLIFGASAETIGSISGTGGTIDVADARLIINQSTNASYAGTIVGNLSSIFTKSGSAYLDLLGDPFGAFAGLTKVDQGILYLNRTPGLQTTGAVQVNGGNAWVYRSNQIADTASVTINSGIDLRALSTLTVNNGGAIVYSGAITGAGALVKNGPGELLLNGTANYTGGTTINNGTLRGTTASLQGNFSGSSSGILLFDQTTSGNYTGNLSGAIIIGQTMNSGNILTLSGTNTHSGATFVLSGEHRAGSLTAFSPNSIYELGNNASAELHLNGHTLTIGGLRGGGATGGNVNLAGGNLTITQNTSATYAGAITGTGSVIKNGTGTLALSGANTFNGTLHVNTGRVNVNGSLTGPVELNSGILGGTGSLQAVTIHTGSIAPGNSPGNLTMQTFTMNAGTYSWELAALSESGPGVNFDLLTVTGNATLASGTQVQLLFTGSATNPDGGDPFWNSPRQWAILDSNGLTGNFSSIVSGNYTSGSFSVLAVNNDVMLKWTPVPEPGLALAFPVVFAILVNRRRLR
jgi:fibronectin-binding autotransporter adhesin